MTDPNSTLVQPCRNYGMTTLGRILERNAVWWPDRDAFVLGDRRQTYRTLYDRSSRLAAALEGIGTLRQDRIGMLSTNSIEYFEFFSAAEIAGFIATPVSFRAAPPEIEYLVSDSGIAVLFFERDYAAVVDGLRPKLGQVRHYVCIGGDAPAWAFDYEALLASGDPQGPVNRATPEDIAHLFYTSGTTGKPKGVPLGQSNQVLSARS
ncbi:MAG TPA: AMP-binding protein, partial [Novosphingobium sp.]